VSPPHKDYTIYSVVVQLQNKHSEKVWRPDRVLITKKQNENRLVSLIISIPSALFKAVFQLKTEYITKEVVNYRIKCRIFEF